MEYKCNKCGCKEFVSNPNRYDVFQSQNEKLILIETEYVNEELILYCRECSEKLEFNNKDVIL